MEVGPVVASSCVFLLTYGLIFSERVHRTIAALAGAVTMMVLGTLLGFYPQEAIAAAVDVDSLWLLFGMMVIVGLLQHTGFFAYLAIRAAQLARGRPGVLLLSLAATTALASTLLDNLTTMITIAPVTLSIADVLGLSPVPFLLAEVLAANIGGGATLVGDPPNVLIGSTAGFTFLDFLGHTAPVALIALLSSLLFLLARFHRHLRVAPERVESLLTMNPREALAQPQGLKRLLISLGLVVILFLLHGEIGLSPGLVALVGAAGVGLLLRPPLDRFLSGVEWGVLVFLLSLFVVVGGVEAAGVLEVVSRGIFSLAAASPLVLALFLLWVGAGLGAVMSAIPTTVMLIPVVQGLGQLGVSLTPLWWSLALGIGLGANATPIGTAANLTTLAVAERSGTQIGARLWFSTGLPVAVLSCLIASMLLWLAWGWFS